MSFLKTFVSLKLCLNLMLYNWTTFRSFSEVWAIFSSERSPGLQTTLWESLEIFRKCSEIFGNLPKMLSFGRISYITKRKLLHVALEMHVQNFVSHLETYCTHLLCSLVKYFLTLEEKYVSLPRHVISFVTYTVLCPQCHAVNRESL